MPRQPTSAQKKIRACLMGTLSSSRGAGSVALVTKYNRVLSEMPTSEVRVPPDLELNISPELHFILGKIPSFVTCDPVCICLPINPTLHGLLSLVVMASLALEGMLGLEKMGPIYRSTFILTCSQPANKEHSAWHLHRNPHVARLDKVQQTTG